MPVTMDPLPLTPTFTPTRPLAGMTVLVVEDSRFASEAVRLLCLKSGARIRRADSLRSARRHLGVYMPSVVIVDLGLPDGSGISLISDLSAAHRIPVILATSGDDRQFPDAIAAGADGVLAKPIESLGLFQKTVLDHLPVDQRPAFPRLVSDETVSPDAIAFRDDLSLAADLLSSTEDESTLTYITQFLTGVARSARDDDLEAAAMTLAARRKNGGSFGSDLAKVAGMLQDRIEKSAVI